MARQLDRIPEFELAMLLDAAREELMRWNRAWVTWAGVERYLNRQLTERMRPPAEKVALGPHLARCANKLDEIEQRILAQRSFVQSLENELRNRNWQDAVRVQR